MNTNDTPTEAEEYWLRIEKTGMAHEFTPETLVKGAFRDGQRLADSELAAERAKREECEAKLTEAEKERDQYFRKTLSLTFEQELAALKAAKEEAEAVAGQRYHYALNEPILKARIEELSQDRDVCLVRAEKAEAEVARLKASHDEVFAGIGRIQRDDLRASLKASEEQRERLEGALRDLADDYIGLRGFDARHTDDATDRANAERDVARVRDLVAALANREAAQQTREEAKEGSCVHCGKPWYGNMPQCVFHPDTPQQAAQPSATQGEEKP